MSKGPTIDEAIADDRVGKLAFDLRKALFDELRDGAPIRHEFLKTVTKHFLREAYKQGYLEGYAKCVTSSLTPN